MYSPFDLLAKPMFGVTAALMGYTATWMPTVDTFSDDFGNDYSGPQTARGHYKDATGPYQLAGQQYDEAQPSFEYMLPDFAALKKLVDKTKTRPEKLVIPVRGEVKEFYVRSVDTKYDGLTCVAKLEPIEPDEA